MHVKPHHVVCGLFVTGAFAAGAFAQEARHDSHIAIDNPAELSRNEAKDLYTGLKERMEANYAVSQMPEIRDYQAWTPYNTAPYLSATHGRRYVNNYANEAASRYGDLRRGKQLPAGSVLVKDSLTVTSEGNVFPGALFGMEKLATGTSPETADWRYFMVIPDGSIYGDTAGDNPELMAYCHECHLSVADRDYTFFIPEGYRTGE